MANKKKSPPRKEMSEGKAIAISVLLFTAGAVALVYAIKFLINYFFPGF
ncbi:hypothetical protein SAMN05443144_11468 [Fodinibius roseus]|uniref:Uncharacterized protein n=1 Tax=Fodinibius roseus TaxID=1194090 RepID=A0A1M5F6R3_9BACT|nr:hypothetical protein [Fodinibius roseus]SHF86742.1 hypothetical protein SAMN05443144_11468 [Fodinibius roseus]